MTFRAARFTVAGTAVKILEAAAGDLEACISVHSSTGTDSVFLGGDAGVTVANGYRLENTDNTLRLTLAAATDDLWAISADTAYVHVLVRGT